MKILIIDVFRYVPGGINYYSAIHLYDMLMGHGYDVDIMKYPYYENKENIPPIDFQTALGKKYDIIIVTSILGFEYVNKYKKITKEQPRIIIISEEDYLDALQRKIGLFDLRTKKILKNFISSLRTDDICLTSNYEDMKSVREYFGINTEYIETYIDEKYFLKNEKETKSNFQTALFANKLSYKQNSMGLIIKAVKYIKNKTDFLEKHNLLIDVTAFGEDYERFIKDVYRNKLSDLFRFVSVMPTDKYIEYLKSHRFTIVLPRNITHNREMLESMAAGVPVLIDSSYNKHSDPYVRSWGEDATFFSNTMSEIIKDTQNGFVFESGNYIDLADKIMLMLTTNLTDIRRNAFETALKFKPEYFDQRIIYTINRIMESIDKQKIMSEI